MKKTFISVLFIVCFCLIGTLCVYSGWNDVTNPHNDTLTVNSGVVISSGTANERMLDLSSGETVSGNVKWLYCDGANYWEVAGGIGYLVVEKITGVSTINAAGLPTTNPHSNGALWVDNADGYTVKRSTG